MKKDRIYILLMTLSVGGAERHASYIANHLSDLGYDVRIVLLANGCVDYQLRDNIKVVDLQKENYPDYKLVIYGEGPEKQNIQNCIKENRLETNVEIRPFASNVLELICDCAMFVSSSDREGLSNSMIEAMAIGMPTICTDCPAGGARMFIKPYENGILTPVGDAEALYKAMKYMIENPDKAEQIICFKICS